ncbi:MAG: phosphogluconate dehydratase [Betaproteobacteria bacterium RIFCSPLOWO2_12_FULL_63_13]|nr:MAG: phosphogluconate dehydratase [Betaproteobacteria bacterium RIFCSPLOWO2_12_FULL_63_13]
MSLHTSVNAVTERIRGRSQDRRAAYLSRIDEAGRMPPCRESMGCANLAHAFAASPRADKQVLYQARSPNIAIVSAYNDMLSAHQPLERFPGLIKQAARDAGATAQFAGGVPAMCDGVTQGEDGMELSLFSRDVIALATAVALSHNVFDAVLCLGVCDKIVPGLLIGALKFGHLPALFVPAGPMTSGLSNDEKSKIRQLFAQGKVGRDALLEAESKAYHGAGTCTFYGTANSNQMLMEMMGLHLPGAAFVTPNTPLRDALTAAATRRAAQLAKRGPNHTPIGALVDERVIVNGIVGLLATGGSTNHTIHLVAMARAAGILINWDDFNDLSAIVPLLARIYPNGKADVNHFHAAGGIGFLIRELLSGGLLHADVMTVAGEGLSRYAEEPWLNDGVLGWRPASTASGDEQVLRPLARPFSGDGGLKLIRGNLGRAVIKISAVKPEHRHVAAPARVFDGQQALIEAYRRGELNRDFIAVVIRQGPRANGMPELHKLTPILSNLQDAGHSVAMVTDGRMSGASGKVPAVIHVTPETLAGGLIGKLRDGDMLELDCDAGTLTAHVPQAELEARAGVKTDLSAHESGCGRELFGLFRRNAASAEEGASPALA